MLDNEPIPFAVTGDRGIDLFRRFSDEGQRRGRYECIATLHPDPAGDGRLEWYDAAQPADRSLATRALDDYRAAGFLHRPFALGHTAAHPQPDSPAERLLMFLHLDFFRARQVALVAIAGFEAMLRDDPARAARHYARTAETLKLVFDFNLLDRAGPLCDSLAPALAARVRAPGFVEDDANSTGFALRLAGDLFLRRGEAGKALDCFEAAIDAADNPFRRRKAILAAHAAGREAAFALHLAAYEGRWKLPADLAALRDAPEPQGSAA